MLLIALVGIGLAFVVPLARRLVDLHWPYLLGILAGEILFVLLACFLSDRIAELFDGVPKECPKCGGEIVLHSSGFYDFSFVPHMTDVLITLIFLALHVVCLFGLYGIRHLFQ